MQVAYINTINFIYVLFKLQLNCSYIMFIYSHRAKTMLMEKQTNKEGSAVKAVWAPIRTVQLKRLEGRLECLECVLVFIVFS
jgi:hypothetical protein